jgi:hypothetical protein
VLLAAAHEETQRLKLQLEAEKKRHESALRQERDLAALDDLRDTLDELIDQVTKAQLAAVKRSGWHHVYLGMKNPGEDPITEVDRSGEDPEKWEQRRHEARKELTDAAFELALKLNRLVARTGGRSPLVAAAREIRNYVREMDEDVWPPTRESAAATNEDQVQIDKRAVTFYEAVAAARLKVD